MKHHWQRWRSDIFVTFHLGSGSPYALRVNLQKISQIALMTSVMAALGILGTLLFFRELELNRKLEQRVLELELDQKLNQLKTTPVPNTPTVTDSTTPTAPATPKPASAESTPKPTEAAKSPLTAMPSLASVPAQLNQFQYECTESKCSVNLSMVPNGSGYAQGELILVLETEVLRIGTAIHNTDRRSQFFIYPGYGTRDQMTTQTLSNIQGKKFKFSKGLLTKAQFIFGKQLKPIAIDAYLYDSEKNLVQHKRKPIEKLP